MHVERSAVGLSATMVGLLWLLWSPTAAAQTTAPSNPAPTQAALLAAVGKCRAMADSEARLSCYDRAAGDLLDAERMGDILVVDRKRVERANRAAFGFNLPSFNLLDRGGKPEPVDSLQGVAAQAFPNASGGWTVVLEDGARWTQIGRDPLRHDPRAGSKIEIRKAAMGSFFLSVDGQVAIRAKRIN